MPEETEFQEDLNGNDPVGSEDVVVGEKVLDRGWRRSGGWKRAYWRS